MVNQSKPRFFMGVIKCNFYNFFTPFDVNELLIAFKSEFSGTRPN